MLLNPGPGCVVGSWEFHCECLQCQFAWVIDSILAGWAGRFGVGKHLILFFSSGCGIYSLVVPVFGVGLFNFPLFQYG